MDIDEDCNFVAAAAVSIDMIKRWCHEVIYDLCVVIGSCKCSVHGVIFNATSCHRDCSDICGSLAHSLCDWDGSV